MSVVDYAIAGFASALSVVMCSLYILQMSRGYRKAEVQRIKSERYKPGGSANSAGDAYTGFAYWMHKLGMQLAAHIRRTRPLTICAGLGVSIIGLLFGVDPSQQFGVYPGLVVLYIRDVGLSLIVATGSTWFYWSTRGICGPLRIPVPKLVIAWCVSYSPVYLLIALIGDTLSITRNRLGYQSWGTAVLCIGHLTYGPLCIGVYILLKRALASSLRLAPARPVVAAPAATPVPVTAVTVVVTPAVVESASVQTAAAADAAATDVALPNQPASAAAGTAPSPLRIKPAAVVTTNDPSEFARRALRSLMLFSFFSILLTTTTLVLTISILLSLLTTKADDPTNSDGGPSGSDPELLGQLAVAAGFNLMMLWYSWLPPVPPINAADAEPPVTPAAGGDRKTKAGGKSGLPLTPRTPKAGAAAVVSSNELMPPPRPIVNGFTAGGGGGSGGDGPNDGVSMTRPADAATQINPSIVVSIRPTPAPAS